MTVRVVIADDQGMVRSGFTTLLNSEPDIEVVGEAVNGQEAITRAVQLRPDVILMDVRMPEMDGLEATRSIRALPGCHGQLPILALTAYTSPDEVAQCRDAGMDGHVPKPVDYETLIPAIDRAIAHYVDA